MVLQELEEPDWKTVDPVYAAVLEQVALATTAPGAAARAYAEPRDVPLHNSMCSKPELALRSDDLHATC